MGYLLDIDEDDTAERPVGAGPQLVRHGIGVIALGHQARQQRTKAGRSPNLMDLLCVRGYNRSWIFCTLHRGGFAVLLVLSVAKEFVKLSFAGDEKDPLTNLRLQKLLYYAQAWSLILRESELFPEEIQAWRWGPVIPDVYSALPDLQGAGQLSPDLFSGVPDLPPEEAEFVRSVWAAYNPYSALMLSRMTHQETPWLRAWGDRPKDWTGSGNEPVQVDDIEDYFGAQAVPAPLAAYCHALRKKEEEATRQLANMPPLNAARLASASKSCTPAAHKLCVGGG